MRRRILSLLVVFTLVMSVNIPILAVPLAQQLSNQKKQLLEQREAYDKLQMDFEKLEISIEMLDTDIESIYAAIETAKSEINVIQNDMDEATKDIVIAENDIKSEEDLFNKRMRVMFMNGADSYLEILFNAEGIEDLISRIENVKEIVEYDNKIIKELNHKKKDIEDRKISLNENRTKILALKVDNENKLDKLAIKKEEQSKLIVEAEKQQELHKNEIAATEALLGITRNEIQKLTQQGAKNQVAKVTKKIGENKNETKISEAQEPKKEIKTEPKEESKKGTKVESSNLEKASSISSNEVIAYAENFMGTPYEWGAVGPNTFDCSGFVQYVYAHFGIKIGRTTYDQIYNGEFVSRENLEPGDLVFFGTGSPHHVGIYIGNNTYIHAPRTGDVIKKSPLTRSDYLSARRVN